MFVKSFKILKSWAPPLHKLFFSLLILFLPTQLGLHFWPSWSLVNGLRVDYLSPTLYFTDILIFLTLFFWLISIVKTKSISSVGAIHELPLRTIVIFLAIFYLLSFIFYLNPLAHLVKLLKILELFLLGFYISKNLTIKRFNHVAILLSFGIIFESALSLLQFINQSSINGFFYWFGERRFTGSTPGIAEAVLNGRLILRPYGTFSHPNSLAGYFLVSLFLIIYLFSFCHSGRVKSNYFSLFVISFSLLTVFLSFSRSAWFVGGTVFFLIGLFNIKRLLIIIRKHLTLSFALGFALCTLSFALFRPVYYRLSSVSTTDSQSLEKRLDLNKLAWEMFKSSPIIGVGLNNFIPNIPKFTQNEPSIRFYQPVHNIYLLILSETGLLGFSLFIFGIYQLLKVSLRGALATKQSPQNFSSLLILTSLFVILLLGLFDHYWLTLQQNQLLLTLVLGPVFSLDRSQINEYNHFS